jgi:hypothetical protein
MCLEKLKTDLLDFYMFWVACICDYLEDELFILGLKFNHHLSTDAHCSVSEFILCTVALAVLSKHFYADIEFYQFIIYAMYSVSRAIVPIAFE